MPKNGRMKSFDSGLANSVKIRIRMADKKILPPEKPMAAVVKSFLLALLAALYPAKYMATVSRKNSPKLHQENSAKGWKPGNWSKNHRPVAVAAVNTAN